MFGTVIVPLDGSPFAARALGPASRLASALDSKLHVVAYTSPIVHDDVARAVTEQVRGLDDRRLTVVIESVDGSVVDEIAGQVEATPGCLVVMSSVGRSHTGAAMGSVAEGILTRCFGPTLLLGPGCDPDRFTIPGRLVVAVDGSDHSESVIPVAEAWALALGFDVEVLAVLDPEAARPLEASAAVDLGAESNYVNRVAHGIQNQIGRDVDFDVLHDKHPAHALVRRAEDEEAVSLIAMATHGKTGLRRLVAGSVAMGVVHKAPCPVLVMRPPHLIDE